MKNRLKLLRNTKGLTQQEFADAIGIQRGTYAKYEVGRNEPIDAVIRLICQTFHVNENWLRTGVGEMFIETKRDDDIDQLIEKMLKDDASDRKKRLVTAILRLDPEQIEKSVEWMKEAFGLVDAPTAADREKMEIDRKVEEYRAELEASAASRKSAASQIGNEEGA